MLSLLRFLFTLLVCLQLSQVVLYRTFYVAAAATFIVALLVASTHKSALQGMKSRIFHLTALIGYFAVTSLWSLSPSGTLLNALYAAIWIPVFISAVVVFRTTSLAS